MVDLCHGPHLPNTGYLKSAAVGAVNRAFWRADVKREPLQACVLCKHSTVMPSTHVLCIRAQALKPLCPPQK
jgi:hypothetical protein